MLQREIVHIITSLMDSRIPFIDSRLQLSARNISLLYDALQPLTGENTIVLFQNQLIALWQSDQEIGLFHSDYVKSVATRLL